MAGSDTAVDSRDLDVAYPVTDEQVRSIQEDSWAWLPGLLSAEEAARLRETLLSSEQSVYLSGPLGKKVDPTQMLKHEGVAWRNEYVWNVATSRRLSSAIVGLMQRPEAVFTHDISFFKPAGANETRMHQDYSFWPYDRKGCLTLWIALSDIDAEMSPLKYLRGTHTEGPLGAYDFLDGNPQLQDREVVGAPALKAGDAQAHWDLTVHGAGPNNGSRQRDATAFRYHRSDVAYTGLKHPHFDDYELTPGVRFVDSGSFPRINADGLVSHTD